MSAGTVREARKVNARLAKIRSGILETFRHLATLIQWTEYFVRHSGAPPGSQQELVFPDRAARFAIHEEG